MNNLVKIKLANKMLSRIWFIDGKVERGRQLGRKLGYRTCNINIKNYVLPKIGIYAINAKIENQSKKLHKPANMVLVTEENQKYFLQILKTLLLTSM